MKSMIPCCFLMLFCLAVVSGCGGGGGHASAPEPSTTITVVLSCSGTLPAGSAIGGIDTMLILPAGVTPKLTNSAITAGSVFPSGVVSDNTASVQLLLYTAATGNSPGRISLGVHSTSLVGFGPGEFVSLSLNVAPGTTVSSAGFSLSGSSVIDTEKLTAIQGVVLDAPILR